VEQSQVGHLASALVVAVHRAVEVMDYSSKFAAAAAAVVVVALFPLLYYPWDCWGFLAQHMQAVYS
jgi:hypothetical protein